MNTKSLITALVIAVGVTGVAPSQADAKPKHVKKAINKAYKHNHKSHKHYHNYVRKSYNHYYRPYRYDRPKYESESFGIYSTPYGLGFHYSENESRGYGYPGYYW